MKILVTGGAGFVGSHLVDALLDRNHEVVVYDSLESQVHIASQVPPYFNSNARLVRADIRDYDSLKRCILDNQIDIIFHEAAAVGVGQSMYEIKRYVEINTLGGANLLDILANNKHRVQKILVASSMSIYGEGKYECPSDGAVYPRLRPQDQLRNKDWEMTCPDCNRKVSPVGTDEKKPLFPTSIYATTKRDHEEMFLEFGEAYRIPAVALRYFNIYGPRQALSNPYTGVVAIFASRLLNDQPPVIFEDGLQSRDFVHVSEVVNANLLAMENEEADYETFNVGTGHSTSILDVARTLAEKLNKEISPLVLQRFRAGDIRCCYADITKITSKLGFKASVTFDEGLKDLLSWLETQAPQDRTHLAFSELEKRGLAR